MNNTPMKINIDTLYSGNRLFYVTNFYDFALEGYCHHENSLHRFKIDWDTLTEEMYDNEEYFLYKLSLLEKFRFYLEWLVTCAFFGTTWNYKNNKRVERNYRPSWMWRIEEILNKKIL